MLSREGKPLTLRLKGTGVASKVRSVGGHNYRGWKTCLDLKKQGKKEGGGILGFERARKPIQTP